MKILTQENKNYPKNLLRIHNPPQKLYLLGDETILNNFSLAIVGTRRATPYGREITKSISYSLAKQGINIISGLALRSRYRGTQGSNTCKRQDNSGFREWF